MPDKKLWDGKNPYKPCFVPEINRSTQLKFSRIILKVITKKYLDSLTRNEKRWLLLTLINESYYINEIVFEKKSRDKYIVGDGNLGFIETAFLSKEALAKSLRAMHKIYAYIFTKCFKFDDEKIKKLWDWMYEWENYTFNLHQKYDTSSDKPFSFYRNKMWKHCTKYDRGV